MAKYNQLTSLPFKGLMLSTNLHRHGLVRSAVCECNQQQTMNYIVDQCPVTKFDDCLQSFCEAKEF